METQERSKRQMDVFSEKEKKLHVLTKFLLNQELFIRDSKTSSEIAFLKKVNPEATKVLLHKVGGTLWEVGQSIVLYKILGRYVQMEATVELAKGEGQYIVNLEKLAIAKKEREKQRFVVPPGIVWITNILVTKAKIETDMFQVPMAVKVSFEDFQHRMKEKIGKTDLLTISVFKDTDNDRIKAVKKTSKILFIANANDESSFSTSLGEDFLIYDNEVDTDVEDLILTLRKQGILSEVIIPILYINEEDESSIPIGYVHWQTKGHKLDFAEVIALKTQTFEMIDRLRNSNMMTITEKFPVMDISEGGLKVKINNAELHRVLPKIPGFNFDIFFKMQSPITCYGSIKSIRPDEEGNMIVGLSIAGHSSRKGEKLRFIENVEYFKKNYGNGSSI